MATSKFPNFGRNWFDSDGQIVIPGPSNLIPKYRNEIDRYRKFKEEVVIEDIEERALLKKLLTPSEAGKNKAHPSASVSKGKYNSSLIPHNVIMPRPTKRSQNWKKRKGGKRRSGLKNKALKSVKVPFKKIIDVDTNQSGTETGIYFNDLKLKELEPGLLTIYQEFKCVSMRVRFFPEDISSGSGLYTAILVDQSGFGAPARGAASWFPHIADMPGSRVCHVTRGFTFDWKPTEPDSRNYRNSIGDETNYSVATLYIFGKTNETRVKGSLLITGAFRARGEYYKSDVSIMIKRLRELNIQQEEDCDASSLEDVGAIGF